MPISWTINQSVSTNEIDFTPSFTANGLLISVDADNVQSQNLKIGYLRIAAIVDGEFYNYALNLIQSGKSILSVPLKNYKLSFIPTDFQSSNASFTLKITPYNFTEIMGINYAQVDKVTGAVVDTVATAAITTFQVLPVDTLRHEGTIYNRTNRILYVKWGTTAATTADLAVPVGANLDIPEDYTGAVQGISAAGVTGSVLSQTISYV